MKQHKLAFTLIELLIVVAIIAILAAIAVPNFLEAQTRAEVGRIKADIRSMVVALEMYRVDNRDYPDGGTVTGSPWGYVVYSITTPIAYITALPRDTPFGEWVDWSYNGAKFRGYLYWGGKYWRDTLVTNASWQIVYAPSCAGSDYIWQCPGPMKVMGDPGAINAPILTYDPSNGTVSYGDILYVGGSGGSTVNSFR